MFKFIQIPLGGILYFCYMLVQKNYALALILFTLIIKIILLPLAVKQQKNTAHMASVAPKLEKINSPKSFVVVDC